MGHWVTSRHTSEHITEVQILLIRQILKGDSFSLFLIQLQLFSSSVFKLENDVQRHSKDDKNAVATRKVSDFPKLPAYFLTI
jgi:hypothetical protein